jgi:N-acetylmuramoyl-L-alanine amidase
VNIARKHNADLFISIHADAIKRKNVRGMSIYTLSETASDKEAAALAKKENQSDIIAGIDFADQPPEVANILIDLAQRETKNLSVKFANLVVDNARGKTRLLDRTHRFAGFRVLKAPDVPSVLIELGFLTNRSDEKQLLSSAWRRKVAGAMVNSVDGFFRSSRLAALR